MRKHWQIVSWLALMSLTSVIALLVPVSGQYRGPGTDVPCGRLVTALTMDSRYPQSELCHAAAGGRSLLVLAVGAVFALMLCLAAFMRKRARPLAARGMSDKGRVWVVLVCASTFIGLGPLVALASWFLCRRDLAARDYIGCAFDIQLFGVVTGLGVVAWAVWAPFDLNATVILLIVATLAAVLVAAASLLLAVVALVPNNLQLWSPLFLRRRSHA